MEMNSVAAASIQMHMMDTMQQASVALLRRAMQAEQSEAAAVVEQLETAMPAPPSDRLLDIHI